MLPTRLAPDQMRVAAGELAVAETVFLFKSENTRYEIRAYDGRGLACDPVGTGAIAAGHVLFTEGHVGRTQGLVLDAPTESFRVERRADHTTLIVLPRRAELAPHVPAPLATFAATPVLTNGVDLIIPLASEHELKEIDPFDTRTVDWPGKRAVFTAPSSSQRRDFVVRTFSTEDGRCVETAVSGAAYRALGPYWLERLNAPILRGEQLDARGGVVHVEAAAAHALAISGQCVTTVKGIFVVLP